MKELFIWQPIPARDRKVYLMKSYPVEMANFDDIVEKHEIVLLDFWAEWCQPCKTLSPLFEELAAHNTDIFFGKVNTETAKDLAAAFQVKSIPTLMAFKQGQLVFEQTGLLPPPKLLELLDWLRKLVPAPLEELEPIEAE